MAAPEVTVLVVAHARRGYVAEALRSVGRQRLDRRSYEVVLATDLSDPELDRVCVEEGVVRVEPTPGNWAEWVSAALPSCRGRVVSFLDDDDLLEPEKVGAVLAAFRAREGLGYYHNRVRRFTSADPPVPPRDPPRRSALYGPHGGLLPNREKTGARSRALFWQGGGFNTSSIAVRRELLDSALPELRQIEASHSLALFYAALLGPWDLYFDPAPLTRYRIHGANWSATPGTGLRSQWHRLEHDAPVLLRDARRIARRIEDSENPRVSSAPVRSVEARCRLLQTLGPEPASARSRIGALVRYVARTPPAAAWGQRGLLALGTWNLWAPSRPYRWLTRDEGLRGSGARASVGDARG